MPPPTKTPETKPTDTPPEVTNPPTALTPAAPQPDHSAELRKVTAERDGLKAQHARTQMTIRKLCAAILTPPEEADRGVARSQSIRNNLLALVDAIAPSE